MMMVIQETHLAH